MASIHDRFEVAHLVVVAYDVDGQAEAGWDRGAERYRAECSCGWSGDWHHDGALAEADGDDHREVVVGPGDRLDRFMGELLDLQEDVAQVVIWLAENWSAYLPTPSARALGSADAIVVVSVYCTKPDDLAEAAQLLGVPLVDETAPDRYGMCYRRAVRRFGRVEVEAFRRIDPTCSGCGTETAEPVCPMCGQHAEARRVTVEVA